jgi:hypothetical protein
MASSPKGKYSKYDEFIPVLTNNALTTRDQFMCLPLFLHQLEENYNSSTDGSSRMSRIAFRDNVYYPIADAHNLEGSSSVKGTISKEFLILVGNVLVNLKSIDVNMVAKATKLATESGNEWFKDLLKNLYTEVKSGATVTSYTVKNKDVMYNDLNIINAFNFENNTGYSRTQCTPGTTMSDQVLNCIIQGLTADKYLTTKYPYKIDKYLLTILLDQAYKSAVSNISAVGSTSFFTTSSNLADEKFYYRKPADPSKLYKLVNGVDTEVQSGSQEFKDLQQGSNCYNLGFIGTASDGQKCEDLITKCLSGRDVSNCKAFMSNATWWNENSNVDDVNPEVAINMLQSFGFATNTNNTNSGLKLKQFQTPLEWIANLTNTFVPQNKLSTSDVTSIAGNSTLMGYLTRLVIKINKNPAVLNTGYTGSDSVTTDPFAGTTLTKYGVSGRRVDARSGVPSVSSIMGLQTQAMNQRVLVAPFYNMIGVGTGLIYQRGGAGSILDKLPMSVAPQLKVYFESFVGSLKAGGKDLAKDDKDQIFNLIAQLDTTEEKLRKAVIYTEKYTQLLSVYGNMDKGSVMNFDNIQKFVDTRDKSFQKVGDRQTKLFEIELAVAEAVRTELAAHGLSRNA